MSQISTALKSSGVDLFIKFTAVIVDSISFSVSFSICNKLDYRYNDVNYLTRMLSANWKLLC